MILNLTQHPATDAQRAAGVVDLTGDELADAKALLTFDAQPAADELADRAEMLAMLASLADVSGASDDAQNAGAERYADAAMIGGAPYLMAPLESALRTVGIQPLYAFSRRESVEETQPDGRVTKRNVFHHLGFVRPLIM